jgi:hypothetical protein
MNKRYAYPIFIVLTFVSFQVATRLVYLMIVNEGGSLESLLWVYTLIDFLMILFVPVLILLEARDNKNIKKMFYAYVAFAISELVSNSVQILNFTLIRDDIYYIASLLILAYIVYIGYQEEKLEKPGLRIGRAIFIAGFLNLLYLFMVPSTIMSLRMTYENFGLNTFVLLILIMQGLILDEVLMEKQKILDANRKVL